MAQLDRIISNIRLQTNESLADDKYDNTAIIDLIKQCWPQIVEEINRLAGNPIIVRHTISVTANQAEYILPPHVGEVLWLAKIDDETGLISWEVRPRSLWNPYGPRVTWEGNVMRLQPVFQSTTELQLWYIPNGEISPVTGTIASWTPSTKTALLSSAATIGTFDKRTNAYAGYFLSCTDAGAGGHTETLTVNSSSVESDGKTSLVTNIVFADFTPFVGDVIELMPMGLNSRIELAVSLYCSSVLLSFETDAKQVQLIERQYSRVMRGLRMGAARFEGRVGKYWDRQTPEHSRSQPGFGGNFWTWSLISGIAGTAFSMWSSLL